MKQIITFLLILVPFTTINPITPKVNYPYFVIDEKKAYYLDTWNEGNKTFWIGTDGFYYGIKTKEILRSEPRSINR